MKTPTNVAWTRFTFQRCEELVTARHCSSDLACAAPGSIVRDQYAHLGLHFAPRRWLLLEPDDPQLAELLLRGARCCEASGKWKIFTATTSQALRTLATAIDVEEILNDRQCARTYVFDCPVVLARFEHSFIVCVESSYEAAWRRLAF